MRNWSYSMATTSLPTNARMLLTVPYWLSYEMGPYRCTVWQGQRWEPSLSGHPAEVPGRVSRTERHTGHSYVQGLVSLFHSEKKVHRIPRNRVVSIIAYFRILPKGFILFCKIPISKVFVVYSFGGITENSPLICHPERLRRIYNILIINRFFADAQNDSCR